MSLPLSVGASGEEVRDLHRRLAAIGHRLTADLAHYSPSTAAAIELFQAAHGLDATGICDQATWNTLVEASYKLGDRAVYYTQPMLRGDDIADLQLRLGSLGFDAGRADGIFGPETERAVADFQRNAGLTSDGVAGQQTIAELLRLSARADTSRSVAQVRDHEALRSRPRQLAGLRVAVGQNGPFHALVHLVGRQIREQGAVVLEEHHPDWSTQARNANEFGAEVFLAVTPSDEDGCDVAYFATTGFTSAGGLQLAEICAQLLPAALGSASGTASAMRVAILRETRMPAVVCRIGSPSRVVGRNAGVAAALVEALQQWVQRPPLNE
ncbi:MAG TPA: peptidoglycan-binding protein [Acidimicrobiales bacterium]|nr:peptidoglycan-binding protein [Acidimicrobiales bacterium]